MFGKKEQQHIKNSPKPETFQPEIKEKSSTAKKKKLKSVPSKKPAIGQFLTSIIDGSFLTRKWVIRMLPFILFLVFLAMVYIGNQYSSLRRSKEIEVISNELKELRNEHISTKSELMYQKRMSEIAKRLEIEGIKESNMPPVKIYIKPIKE